MGVKRGSGSHSSFIIPRRPRSSSFSEQVPHSAFPIVVACLALITWIGPAYGQDNNRFLDWSHEDAGNLIEDEWSTILVLGAGGAAFVAAGAQVDEPILKGIQDVVDKDNLFLKITNEVGSAWALSAPVVAFGIGAAADDEKLKDAAFTSFQAILYAGLVTRVLKEAGGRHRPEKGEGARRFKPFSGNSSVPSGHATIAFALITPWVYYYDHPATYALYALGAGTAVSRIVRDKHWPTDVVTGGTIGFLMARYLSKRHLDEREDGYEPVMAMPLLAFRSGGLSISVGALARVR